MKPPPSPPKLYDILSWTPPYARYDASSPPQFSLALNLLFGFAATFTVANLYYSHPILATLAQTFKVSDERVSIIPTVMQGGYAAGLVLVCPLGDIVKRRPFVLFLTLFTATVWLGLCLTGRFEVFVVLSFVTSVTTVTPQVMLPLVGDLAPPTRRATALSIVVSGLLLGMLIARVLSGVIAEYSSWRNVYWMSLGLQYGIGVLLWVFMPDYPRTNTDITYARILWSMVQIAVQNPLLVQCCLMGFFLSATFTSFWTTLTFLLSATPYGFSTVVIGLFGFVGIVPMCFGPLYSRLVIDRFIPQLSILVGQGIALLGIILGTYLGNITLAGPVLQAVLLDFGQQIAQIANRTAIYSVAPKARNRVNTVYMLGVFCGQLMGTAAGNHLFAHGGWVASGSASVGFAGAAIVLCLLRGPRETRWLGWRGGFQLRREKQKQQQQQSQEQEECGQVEEWQQDKPVPRIEPAEAPSEIDLESLKP
ncbi:hypothetical protein ASPZODRAFT_97644 [Penicilliopsis zonata CBS 506.65]|uniref:Major facilitator superfamily (MFS) profile domain-containing protein n=1 Tax=Penicilliopsis zonata CBS 506.65 TaxID=1073090 RepID=A0A1L9SG50_9EURO|nr:hypothetical protein ASPZODRAFT_97644 [Penicilliopsis zonata CBS 506.65]OJJ46093.1 hypothetical protein ASPZODRAFT_97644 [Penicilliopsis zonata CBS 506.65]